MAVKPQKTPAPHSFSRQEDAVSGIANSRDADDRDIMLRSVESTLDSADLIAVDSPKDADEGYSFALRMIAHTAGFKLPKIMV